MAINQNVLDAAAQSEIVTRLAEKLSACYVYSETGEQIGARLIKYLEDGEYAGIPEGELFALALTMHMQEVNHDEHLWVRWHAQPLPEDDEPLRNNQEWQEARFLEARLDNFGLYKVERLAGNIGCLDLRYFHRTAWAGETIAAAMNFLADASALIIDLRRCTGGYPATVALLSSYLFGEEPVHLSSIYWRDDDCTQQYWSLPYVPGKRFGDKPVYVLISQATFSAGEEFASILQTRRRAVILGEQTDGGSHPGTSYRLHPHFEAFIPIGYGINPVTGREIEGEGVTPDICLPQEHAYLAAYHLALEHALAGLRESPAAPFHALAKEIQVSLKSLDSSHKYCPLCAYQNTLSRNTCKNCQESLLEAQP